MKISKSKEFKPQTEFTIPNQLFCDGGVVGKNQKGEAIAGTWSFIRISFGNNVSQSYSGVLYPNQLPEGYFVTNNVTEFTAIIQGLLFLPDWWVGTVWSDSKISLGRVFCGWHIENIPDWILDCYLEAKSHLKYWDQITYGLLDGHPTKEQLESGRGKRGHPVSIHNVWCDKECQRLGRTVLEVESLS